MIIPTPTIRECLYDLRAGLFQQGVVSLSGFGCKLSRRWRVLFRQFKDKALPHGGKRFGHGAVIVVCLIQNSAADTADHFREIRFSECVGAGYETFHDSLLDATSPFKMKGQIYLIESLARVCLGQLNRASSKIHGGDVLKRGLSASAKRRAISAA